MPFYVCHCFLFFRGSEVVGKFIFLVSVVDWISWSRGCALEDFFGRKPKAPHYVHTNLFRLSSKEDGVFTWCQFTLCNAITTTTTTIIIIIIIIFIIVFTTIIINVRKLYIIMIGHAWPLMNHTAVSCFCQQANLSSDVTQMDWTALRKVLSKIQSLIFVWHTSYIFLGPLAFYFQILESRNHSTRKKTKH